MVVYSCPKRREGGGGHLLFDGDWRKKGRRGSRGLFLKAGGIKGRKGEEYDFLIKRKRKRTDGFKAFTERGRRRERRREEERKKALRSVLTA